MQFPLPPIYTLTPVFASQAATMVLADPSYTSRVEWAIDYGNPTGGGGTEIRSIAVDPMTGWKYVSGDCSGTVSIGTVPPFVYSGLFIAEIAPNGTTVQAVRYNKNTFSRIKLAADKKSLFVGGLSYGE